jgi:hypothetical protein
MALIADSSAGIVQRTTLQSQLRTGHVAMLCCDAERRSWSATIAAWK